MLSSFGIRAYTIFIESFFALAFNNSIFIVHIWLGQRHSLAGLESGRDVWPDNVCSCCAGDAIGIEAKSTKCVGRSDAGLVANSPGRRHCNPDHNIF